MTKQEKIAQVADEIRKYQEKAKMAHDKFMITGLHKDKIEHDRLRDEVKMSALQYAILCLDLET